MWGSAVLVEDFIVPGFDTAGAGRDGTGMKTNQRARFHGSSRTQKFIPIMM
jgi:hypothetical protein